MGPERQLLRALKELQRALEGLMRRDEHQRLGPFDVAPPFPPLPKSTPPVSWYATSL